MILIKLEKLKKNILLCLGGRNFVDITEFDDKMLSDGVAIESYETSNEMRVDATTIKYIAVVKGSIIGEKLSDSFAIAPHTSFELDIENKVYVMSGNLKYFDEKIDGEKITKQQTMYDFVANLVIYDKIEEGETNELATNSEFEVVEII